MRRRLPIMTFRSLLWTILMIAILALPVTFAGAFDSKSACQDTCAPATMALQKPYGPEAVQLKPQVYALFWGPWWGSPQGKAESTQLTAILGALHGSSYANVLTPYYEIPGANNQRVYVSNDWQLSGTWLDPSFPRANFKDDGSVLDAAGKIAADGLAASGISPNPDMSVLVFAQTGPHNSRGSSHLGGNYDCRGVHETLAPPGLDSIAVSVVWSGHPKTDRACNLKAASITATHEWAETITNPSDAGWFDKYGQEVADECANLNEPRVLLRPAGAAPVRAYVEPLWSISEHRCVAAAPVFPGNL